MDETDESKTDLANLPWVSSYFLPASSTDIINAIGWSLFCLEGDLQLQLATKQ
jgi:hypothetical protein